MRPQVHDPPSEGGIMIGDRVPETNKSLNGDAVSVSNLRASSSLVKNFAVRGEPFIIYLSVWKANGKSTAPMEASMTPSKKVGSALGHICSMRLGSQ